jgi:23S rRNA pseudouridine2605 synthase
MENSQRLQKKLSQQGLASRRTIEQWIVEGRITINGQPAKLGDKVTDMDEILLDGNSIESTAPSDLKVLCYHKPEGEVCTRSDPEHRPTVFSALPSLAQGRWVMIGRLDFNTRGLLLFTNQGEFAHTLMHPSFEIEREYRVRTQGQLPDSVLASLQKGHMLPEGHAHFDTIEFVGGEGRNQWYRVVLKEGKNREIRRLFEIEGYRVNRLIRVRYGSISLPRDLPEGKCRMLSDAEIEELRKHEV